MLVVALMLVLDLSAGVTAIVPSQDEYNQNENYSTESTFSQSESEIPSLRCNNENCPDKFLGIGFPPWDASPAVEEPYWWTNFTTD